MHKVERSKAGIKVY